MADSENVDFDELVEVLREDCLECGGEGFRTAIRGQGMHAVEFDQTCAACGGTGVQEVLL